MTKAEIVTMVKARLGISTSGRDSIITLAVDATEKWLDDEKGVQVDLTNPHICEFMVDYSTWKYESKGETAGMPRYLDFALKNLIIHNAKPEEEVV
jgi:hypothetical protein